jgi:hypothetical protein
MTSQLADKLEKDIADYLLTNLESENISIERASAISKFILKTLPENISDSQIKELVPKLDSEFIELSMIVHQSLLSYEESQKQTLIDEATALIHHKNLDKASSLMSNYFAKKYES